MDGEMIEMTLSSRHRIRNSSPGGLSPSTLPLCHGDSPQYTWMEKKDFCYSQTAETGNRTPNSGVKGSGANHYPRTPARDLNKIYFIVIVVDHENNCVDTLFVILSDWSLRYRLKLIFGDG